MAVGETLDNETDGGIHTLINNDGIMNGYAVDKFGTTYKVHPDTQMSFNDSIPNFENMIRLSKHVCESIPYTRLVGLDLMFDINQTWRLIEINIFGTTIRFAQYHGEPFFGKFTDEVIEYSLKNHWALSK